jgi:transcriptional regulator with XRE-family HTH domain
MPAARNIIGPQLRRWRNERGLTQPMLVARCNLLGWGLSRETLAKIETRIRWVADAELVCLAAALKVPVEALLPTEKETMQAFFRGLGKA